MFIIIRFSCHTIKAILALFFLFNIHVYAGGYVDFAKIDKITNVTKFTAYTLESTDKKFDPNKNVFPDYYIGNYSNTLRAKYTDKVLWGKINLTNSSDRAITKRYFWDSTLSGYLKIYFKGKIYVTGSSIPFHLREDKSAFPSVVLTLGPDESAILYFRRESHHTLSTNIYLSNDLDFFMFKTDIGNNYRYYVGAILGLIVYNLLLVIFFRSKKYLIYCLFTSSFLLTVLNMHGVLDYVDIFSSTTFSHYLSVSAIVSIALALLFGFIFLDSNIYLKDFKKVKNLLHIIVLAPLILIPTRVFDLYGSYFGYYIDVIIIVVLFFLIFSCVVANRRGSPLAKVYILSWSFVFFGAILYLGNTYGFLPKNLLTENGFLIGNLLEMIVLSLGLAYQVAILDKYNRETLIKAQGKEKYQHLLRTISHDISNSLQVVVIGIKRLKKISDNSRITDIAEKVENSTINIVEILEQIKEQEKLLQDKESIVLSKVNLLSIINEIILIFEDSLIEKNIIVKANIPQSSQIILGERVSIKNNVLGNVLSNSIKFSPDNSEISMSAENRGDKVILTVRDQGKGFSEEALQFLNFELDMTFSTPGTKGETGTGFGLRIIKSYVKMYSGTLYAYNDNGAVFEFTFLKAL